MKILLIAGTHGNEQAAVMASVKALQQFNLVKRSGEYRIVFVREY